MINWYIKVDGQGSASTHVVADALKNPLTSASGDKVWYKPATLTKPTPGDGERLSGPVYDIEAGTITYSTEPAPVTQGMVQAECARRLAAGFDYDFADGRGVHTIGTTEKDMDGWREVTDLANARIATSDTTAITIATDTGTCQVTPTEWQAVLKAAAAFRQPIWGYSFALQAQDPIPSDYTDDSHWTSE